MHRCCTYLAAAVLALAPGCWPGRCEGGFRALHSPATSVTRGISTVPASAVFILNVDTSAKSGDDLLRASGLDGERFFLEGPTGRVPAALDATIATAAHSCASAGSVTLRPTGPLAPGDYELVVLLDGARWPTVGGAKPTQWRGRSALVQRYRVP